MTGFLDPDSIFNTGVDLRDAIESDGYLADLIFVDCNPAEEAFCATATVPDVRPGNTTSPCFALVVCYKGRSVKPQPVVNQGQVQ